MPRQARSNNDPIEAENVSKIDIPNIMVVVTLMAVKNVLLYEKVTLNSTLFSFDEP